MPAPKKTPELFRSVVADFIHTGNLSEAARRNNLDTSLLPQWRKKYSDDWHAIEQELIAEISLETKATFHRNLTLALQRIEERLETGDVVCLKGGHTVTVPVRARDCAVITAVLFDKLRLIEGKATKITQDSGRVSLLMEEFRRMGEAYRTGQVLEHELPGNQIDPGAGANLLPSVLP